MKDQYDHKKIESKWQKVWKEKQIYKSTEKEGAPKCYVLDMFPYPSGEGLHVGHPKGYIATDIYSRYKKMTGFNILHPMGWDAFGLPAENYAIKNKVHPKVAVDKNIARYKSQLSILGLNYDWDREINTTDPKYYKWTQWVFLKMFEKGLAYESFEPINWCPSCKTGLANEDLDGDRCERCGTKVEKKPLRQWVLKITDYADRLLKDLNGLDWPESIKESQRNWIGRSEGVNFKCKVKDLGIEVEMYNSVPQTYRAEMFTVIAPEHALVLKLVEGTKYEKEVMDFVEHIKQKKAGNKFDIDNDLEGIFTGRYIENFAGTGRDLPIWVASYVVADYGTGMVNCSAHDERDYAFAKKYNIPLKEVAAPLIEVTQGEFAFQPGKKTVARECILAIIKRKDKDEYLCLASKKFGWKTYVIGGIEKDEDAVAAAQREIEEETGYKNVRVVRDLGIVYAKHFAPHKDANRFAKLHGFYFELENDEQITVAEEEKAAQEIMWVSKDEMEKTLYPKITDWEFWKRLMDEAKPAVKSGILLEPVEFVGREWKEVREDIINYLVKQGYAQKKTNYKLRDWVFSRQRYWGEPIPIIHCQKCGAVGVPENDLPVMLPEVEFYEPSGTGESPLATIPEWVNVKCPKCGGKGKRETNTMPQWAGSSWYYLRYMDPHNDHALVDAEKEKYWAPVDFYVGGAEHATRHLIYARFWHKFLFDSGFVSTEEPFKKLQHVGLIAGLDGRKMSKRFGNVVNPDDVVDQYGADTLRVYEMFMGPFDQGAAWSSEGILGPRRFLERVWKLKNKITDKAGEDSEINAQLHKTIEKVGSDIADFKFNTAISSLMILVNRLEKAPEITQGTFKNLLVMLAPFAPHIAEELWHSLGNSGSIHLETWPSVDKEMMKTDQSIIVVQINGKVRASFEAPIDTAEDEIKKMALSMDEILKWTEGKEIKKVIYVKGKLVSIVV
jgi:leucyl-tRNA synthetase